MSKKLVPQTSKIYDEIYTPKIALNPLLPYLSKDKVIWECAYGEGDLANHLREYGYTVVGTKNLDFFISDIPADVIVTNPPYSKKIEFLSRAYELRRSFAFLLPLTTLEGKARGQLFRENGIQLIIPNRRINFTSGSGAWFAVAWFTSGFNLERDLIFAELEDEKQIDLF